MKCPVFRCQSPEVIRYRTIRITGNREKDHVAKYWGLNLNRRFYKCPRCGHRFFSVEILETLFDELRVQVAGRIAGLDPTDSNQSIRKTGI